MTTVDADQADLFREFDLPEASRSLARGALAQELGSTISPGTHEVAFPPALIPLYRDAERRLVGWWVDPVGSKAPTIVECDPARGYRAVEKFRTWNQLAVHLVATRIVAGGLDAARPLARALQVDVVDVSRRMNGGDAGLLALPVFAIDPPWSLSPRSYRGEWPFDERELKGEALSQVDGLALSRPYQRSLRASITTPPWLVVRLQSSLFTRLVAARRYVDAWHSLNSPGWAFKDARSCLASLTRYAGSNARLRALADYWQSKVHEVTTGYGLDSPHDWWGRDEGEPVDRAPSAVMFRMGHEMAPDSRLGEQSVRIRSDGDVLYRRRQRGREWRHRWQITDGEWSSLCRLVRATPFPRVLPHRFPPGAGVVDLEVAELNAAPEAVSFYKSAPEAAAYDELVSELTILIERGASSAVESSQ